MEIIIETYNALPCHLSKFMINDKEADIDDFGYNEKYGDYVDYTCKNIFFPYETVKSDVLDKYNISKGQYHEICQMLREKLHVNDCGWCS